MFGLGSWPCWTRQCGLLENKEKRPSVSPVVVKSRWVFDFLSSTLCRHTIGNVRKLEGGEWPVRSGYVGESQEEDRNKTGKRKQEIRKGREYTSTIGKNVKGWRLEVGLFTVILDIRVNHHSGEDNISNQHEGHWHDIPSSWYCQRPPISSKFGSWDIVAIDFHTKVEEGTVRQMFGPSVVTKEKRVYIYIYLCVCIKPTRHLDR